MSAACVYLFNVHAARPVFHDYGRIRDEEDVTKCGRVLYDGRVRYTMLREDHARLFCSPCGVCFPDGVEE